MRKKGTVVRWDGQKGFGFIKPGDGGSDVFLHISGLNNRNRQPKVGQQVSYALSTDDRGRPCAVRARFAGDRSPGQWVGAGLGGAVVVVALFLAAVYLLSGATSLPGIALWVYVAASVVTFLVYAVDKTAAKRGGRRTPENTLHALALAGGWPGALVAQQALRHKSKKQSFRFVFWLTVAINCGVLLWFCTPGGADWLQSRGSATIEWAE